MQSYPKNQAKRSITPQCLEELPFSQTGVHADNQGAKPLLWYIYEISKKTIKQAIKPPMKLAIAITFFFLMASTLTVSTFGNRSEPSDSINSSSEVRDRFLKRGVRSRETFDFEITGKSEGEVQIYNNDILIERISNINGYFRAPVAPMNWGTNKIRIETLDSHEVNVRVVRNKEELCSGASSENPCTFNTTPAYVFKRSAESNLSTAVCIDSGFLDKFFEPSHNKNLRNSFETFFKIHHAEPCTNLTSFTPTHSAEYFGIPLTAGRPFELSFLPTQRVKLFYSEKLGFSEAVLVLESDDMKGYLQFKDSRRIKSLLWKSI